MEDAHVIDLNFDKKGTALFGVFDGHGGKEVALFAHHHIVRVLRDKVIPLSVGRGHDDSALMTTLFEEMARRTGAVGGGKCGGHNGEAGGPTQRPRLTFSHPFPPSLSLPSPQDREMKLDEHRRQLFELRGTEMEEGTMLAANLRKQIRDRDGKVIFEDATEALVRTQQGASAGGAAADVVDDGGDMPRAGCTAVCALVRTDPSGPTKLVVANAGDSRCVLSQKDGVARELSRDHKPTDDDELDRIIKAGAAVLDGRVNGSLNLSRALGDFEYKGREDLSAAQQAVTATPEIMTAELGPDDEFILLACDGIWDVLTSEEGVSFVREQLEEGKSAREVTDALCDRCLASDTGGTGKGCDNMTAMVVILPGGRKLGRS